MNYTVIWKTLLLDRLAELYVTAGVAERGRMADGIERFNVQLAADPLAVGESRDDDLRVSFPPLLCVYFFVDEVSRVVRVTKINRYGS